MTLARQLFELQRFDLEIDSRKAKLAEIESQLVESQGLKDLRSQIETKRAEAAKLVGDQKSLEMDSQELQDKSKKSEQALYAGTVKIPKELAALQADLDQTKQQIKGKDETLLVLMSQIEAANAEIQKLAEDYQRLESEEAAAHDVLRKTQGEVQAEVVSLEAQRPELTQDLDQASLSLYQRLRTGRQGRAVATIEKGMCKGCRIVLPATQVQRARNGTALVQCTMCGRILYVN